MTCNLAGQRFGRLVAIEDVGSRNANRLWRCRCDCGDETVTMTRDLRHGRTKSCGCLHATHLGDRLLRHGHAREDKKTTEYNSWRGMIERCSNPKHKSFEYYGGRGIAVCDRWKSFEAFLSDMGPKPTPRHTIERERNDGNYEPWNCRWATRAEQLQNRRAS